MAEYKIEAIRAAGELLYPYEVIKRILKANSESEICRIMRTARENY